MIAVKKSEEEFSQNESMELFDWQILLHRLCTNSTEASILFSRYNVYGYLKIFNPFD